MQSRLVITLALVLLSSGAAADKGYALGFAVSADNGDGFAASMLADLAVAEATTVSAALGVTRASARPEDIRTRDWSLGLRQGIGSWGIEGSFGRSGDPDEFDADDRMLGVFYDDEHWLLSARYLKRDIDVRFRNPRDPDAAGILVPVAADGFRIGVRFRTDERLTVRANWRAYEYDRDLSALGTRFVDRRLSPTTLTLAGALLDRSLDAGIEWPLANGRAWRVGVAQDTLAGELGTVDSVSLGWLTPVGSRGDIDLTIGTSRGDDAFGDDNTVYVGALFLFYGLFE